MHEEVLAGADECLFLVEHPPVITYGRRPGVERHLRATPQQLAQCAIDIVQSDRGGDITYHGPGQLVVYPIIRLADHGLSVSGYVHALEAAVIAYLHELGIAAHVDPAAVGVWVGAGPAEAKICAIGVRIRRGVSMHGLALNVQTHLPHFDLIVPCGLTGRAVTSLARLLGPAAPTINQAKTRLIEYLLAALDRRP